MVLIPLPRSSLPLDVSALVSLNQCLFECSVTYASGCCTACMFGNDRTDAVYVVICCHHYPDDNATLIIMSGFNFLQIISRVHDTLGSLHKRTRTVANIGVHRNLLGQPVRSRTAAMVIHQVLVLSDNERKESSHRTRLQPSNLGQ